MTTHISFVAAAIMSLWLAATSAVDMIYGHPAPDMVGQEGPR